MNIEIARRKIQEAINKNSSSLNLNSYLDKEYLTSDNLLKLLPRIKELTNLKTLDLGNNNLTNIDFLLELTRLTTLNLSSNQITDISFLKELTGLTTLNLSSNQITDTSFLKELTGLTTLNLSSNQLTNVDFLLELKGLTSLDLSSNELNNFDFLSELKGLTSLDLRSNQLTNVDFLLELKGLTSLGLRSNQLTNVDFLSELKGLTSLDLSKNQLTNFDFLAELTQLKYLLLLEIPKIEKLLTPDIIFDYENPRRIINYYFKVKDGKPINEAKIVVVGEADYGKTLLINRLVYDTYINTKRTHSILITEWKDVEVNDEKVKLNIWDFGGQKIMQNTHQYFFTERTIYILVLNARQNEASNKTREHLERIKTIAGDSPIIVVGNKIDDNKGEFDINRSELREEFNIKGFFGVCSNKKVKSAKDYDQNFGEFKEALIKEIGKLDGVHKPFREEWFEIKDHLESLKKKKEPFIKYRDYLKFCFDKNVNEELDQNEIVTFLNELGLVVYLHKKKDGISIEIGDKLIFNPEWLISGVYSVIDNPQKLKRRAILDFNTFKEILSECKPVEYIYQADDYKHILEMMLACKLCVKMKDSETDYLIPDHLKEDKSEVLKEYEEELGELEFQINFQYHYKELFEDIFRRFLIGMYGNVYKEYYWKTGVILEYDNCKALVSSNNAENKIVIQIEGENSRKRQNLLAIIHKEFRDIYQKYPNLDYSEWIAHKDYPHIIKEYEELISIEENTKEVDKRIIYCKELKRYEHIDKFLDNMQIIERDKQLEKEKRRNIIIDNVSQMIVE